MALHLLRAACSLRDADSLAHVKVVHFVKPNEFPEIATFRADVEHR